jgi:hypothetical protein
VQRVKAQTNISKDNENASASGWRAFAPCNGGEDGNLHHRLSSSMPVPYGNRIRYLRSIEAGIGVVISPPSYRDDESVAATAVDALLTP